MILIRMLGVAMFLASSVYLLLALVQILRFRQGVSTPAAAPGVTIMLPCHGTPPRFAECLQSICRQDYPGPLQVVFGLHGPDDAARPVIEALMASMPHLDTALVVDGRRLGTHPKNCNLANMMDTARHDVLVIADSDIFVPPHLVASLVATLERPGVGASTCLYTAMPEAGFASRLGATYINDWFVPSGLVDLAVHGLGTTYGVATAIRRDLLADMGGFAGMASVVSSDFTLGDEVRRRGLKIGLAPTFVATVVAERDVLAMFRHEMRWMRAIRATRPIDHALWISSSAFVPVALLSLAWSAPVALGAVGIHLALRLLIHGLLRWHVGIGRFSPEMLVPRELVNFLLWAGSFMGRRVRWGQHVIHTGTTRETVASGADAPRKTG